MIKASIRDHNPVIFFEHKYLYRRIKDEIPEEDYIVPLGKARVAREGRHLSVITYAAMLYTALEAAEILSKEGIEIEIIDLRTVAPLDREAIVATVKKTSKVIVLHETLAHRQVCCRKLPPSSTKKHSMTSMVQSSALTSLDTGPGFHFRHRRRDFFCPRCPIWCVRPADCTPTNSCVRMPRKLCRRLRNPVIFATTSGLPTFKS